MGVPVCSPLIIFQQRRVESNESFTLDSFAFVSWYVDKEVSVDCIEEAEHLVDWGCKVSLMDLQ